MIEIFPSVPIIPAINWYSSQKYTFPPPTAGGTYMTCGKSIYCKYNRYAEYLFKETPGFKIDAGEKDESEKDLGPEKERYIVCKYCGNIITSKQDAIEINGSHLHVFKNPAGIIYHIGCYYSARGCLTIGEPTYEYTWFPGFRWCHAICSKCLAHLGWQFISDGSRFYSLILDNITENSRQI